jgi:phage terminase large subunit-like protein
MAGTPIATPEELDTDWAQMRRVLCRESLIEFIREVAPWFTIEEVHCVIAEHLEAVARGEIDRLMIAMPPRAGKSQMASIFLPSWWGGKFPSDKILQVGHSTPLSRNFSLDVRELMALPAYRWIFPGVQMSKSARAAGRWRLEEIGASLAQVESTIQRRKQGEYKAAGVTTGIAGIGFNLGVVDDAMSEQDKDSKLVKDRLWNWWGPGFYTRRQPEKNAIVLSMTRWAKDDLPGRLLDQARQNTGADKWTVLNIPAFLDKDSARKLYIVAKEYGAMEHVHKFEEGDSFSPVRWSKEELLRSKAQLTEDDWNALYQGTPTRSQGFVLKSQHWRLWPKKDPPQCLFVFQMYDTAFDEKTRNDYSARTTWGVFEHRERDGERPSMHMILLDRWKDRVEAPDLKKHVLVGAWGGKEAKRALLEMNPTDPEMAADIDETKIGMHPDRILIENKASGIWLIKELRKIRKPRPLPIWPWMAPRGGRGQEMGKYARAVMASLVLEQGAVWYMNRNWAQDVIKECAECRFDGTDDSDDLPDTVTSAMIYVRQTYRVELGSDIDEEAEAKARIRRPSRQFYGARR